MFNKQNLEKIFEGKKEFGYGKWMLYIHAKEYDSEEEEVDVKILDGIIELIEWDVNEETHERTHATGMAYVPFENIFDIQFGKDF